MDSLDARAQRGDLILNTTVPRSFALTAPDDFEFTSARLVVGGRDDDTVPVPDASDPDSRVWVFDAVEEDGSWSFPAVAVPVRGDNFRVRYVVNGELVGVGKARVDGTGQDSASDGSISLTVGDEYTLSLAVTGARGPAGPAGEDGTPGADGTDGAPGADGEQGPPGVVAATGLATYDPETQTIDVTATAADVGAVPTSRTVNGKALTSNVTLAASDVSAVPTTRTLAGLDLTADRAAADLRTALSVVDALTMAGAIANVAGDRAVTNMSGGQRKIVSGGSGNAIAVPVNTAQILGGGQTNYENVIGASSTSNVGTANSNLPTTGSSNANYSTITGGYDNVANGLMSTVSGAHNLTEAASDHGTISGGSFQKITGGSYGTIAGGTAHTASGTAATISGGTTNTASAIQATIAGGSTNTASGQGSAIAGGLSNTTSGTYSLAAGRSCTASASYTRADGYQARAYTEGMEAHASGRFAADGDAQTSRLVLRNTTTNNTATILGPAGAAAHHQMQEPASCTFHVLVVAREPSTGDSKAWEIKGLAQNNTGGNVTLVGGAPTPTVIAASTGAAAWTCAIATGSNSLGVTGTGETSKTIRWVATFTMVEVGG